jgi:predicted XRE-type DNA-binding protein
MNADLEAAADASAVVNSSGNVFVDLGIEMSDEDMLKVQIARAINNTIQRRELTQQQAAEIINTDQAKVSALLRGNLKGFGVERLFRFLLLLGRDVDIRVSHKLKPDRGRIRFHNVAA